MRQSAKRAAIATLFGAMISVTKTFVPSPINKMLILVQALLLALSALLLGKMGATYVASIGGVLTALLNLPLAHFTLVFAILFGLFVDGFFLLFKVNIAEGRVQTGRLMVAMILSTTLVGVLSYYVTVHLVGLMPRNLPMEAFIFVMGMISGVVGGYLASAIWNRHLKDVGF